MSEKSGASNWLRDELAKIVRALRATPVPLRGPFKVNLPEPPTGD